MNCPEMLRSAFTNFSFTTPSDKFLDGRTVLYCIPVIRDIMRIATAFSSITKEKTSSDALPSDYEVKRDWKDIAKWIAGSFVAGIIPIFFLPYIGVISAVATLFALIATGYQRKDDFRTLTPGRVLDLWNAKAPGAA